MVDLVNYLFSELTSYWFIYSELNSYWLTYYQDWTPIGLIIKEINGGETAENGEDKKEDVEIEGLDLHIVEDIIENNLWR